MKRTCEDCGGKVYWSNSHLDKVYWSFWCEGCWNEL